MNPFAVMRAFSSAVSCQMAVRLRRTVAAGIPAAARSKESVISESTSDCRVIGRVAAPFARTSKVIIGARSLTEIKQPHVVHAMIFAAEHAADSCGRREIQALDAIRVYI